jgi:hypothetical protein
VKDGSGTPTWWFGKKERWMEEEVVIGVLV